MRAYLEYLRVERGLSANTLQAYSGDLRRFVSWLQPGTGLVAVTRGQIGEYIRYLREHDLGVLSVVRAMVAVRGWYRFMLVSGRITEDPTATMIVMPRRGVRLPRPLPHADVRRMIDGIPDTEVGRRDRALLELLSGSGLRASECAGLRFDNLDLDAGTVRAVGKGDRERIVPLNRDTVAAMREYARVRAGWLGHRLSPAWFCTPAGRRVSRAGVWAIVRHAARAAGLSDVHPHTLRHSFATHAMEAGANLTSVQLMLGHADPATTQIYLSVSAAHLREIFDRFHPRA